MSRFSPPKAWFYLKKRQALRRAGAGGDSAPVTPPATTTLTTQYAAPTLSNGDLTAASGSGNWGARSVAAIPAGSFYFEAHADTVQSFHGVGVGVATGTGAPGSDGNNSCVLFDIGSVWKGSDQGATGAPSFTTGDTIGVKIVNNGDGTGTVAFTKDGAAWSSAVAIDLVLAAGPIYALVGNWNAGSANGWSANFGASAYLFGLPAGCANIPG